MMKIGIPKEVKINENRVGIIPNGVYELVQAGHTVMVEQGAGLGSGIEDQDYISAGATMMAKQALFEDADVIVKVKEPLKEEYEYFKEGQMLFTYLHLASDKELTDFLLKKNITAIAYETIQKENGFLPLLNPMSEVAGRMAVQVGANLLQKNNEGRGIILAGVPGIAPAEVVVVGAGNVGKNAVKVAAGMGAHVTVLDICKEKLDQIDDLFFGRVTTLMSNPYNLAEAVKNADLVIGAVLIPGGKAPKLVTEAMVKTMKKGSVVVDVAIDQGGCIETIDRVTTHDNPYFIKYDVVHYSVANMPGAVPRTSTYALDSATLPYLKQIVSQDIQEVLKNNVEIAKGLNTYQGKVANEKVAQAWNLPCSNPFLSK